MSKQSVSLVEFSELYNILYEIKDLFNFDIFDYQKSKDFMLETESNNTECINSIIIINKKNNILFSNDKINRNNILLINELPISVEKLLDKINAQLIKQKYNFQSNFNIKDYLLNLNSRVISKKKNELKLTEKEIDIILFLNNKKTPQSVVSLENEVWGHSFQLETHTVETHVYRLRKKIKNKFNDENFIISYEEGYKI
jgi:hypothetical protein